MSVHLLYLLSNISQVLPSPDLLGESYADANKTGFHRWEKTEISMIYKPVKYELKDVKPCFFAKYIPLKYAETGIYL